MDEQPSAARSDAMNTPTPPKRALGALFLFLRLLVAFLCGWLLAWLGPEATSLYIIHPLSFLPSNPIVNFLLSFVNFFSLLFVFPLILGICAPSTVGKQNKHLILLSMGTGLFVLAGIAAYEFPITIPSDAEVNAECAANIASTCHVGGISTALLTIYLIYGVLLMLLSTGITGLIIKRIRKIRQRKSDRRLSALAD